MKNKEKETVKAKDCYAVIKHGGKLYCQLKMKDETTFTDSARVEVCECGYFRRKK